MTPNYSSAPASLIDVASLKSTRFVAIEERKYPYRDALGRVNIHLVNSSLAEAEVDGAAPATCDRLRAWQRHAIRAISQRPKDELMTLDEILDEEDEEDKEVATKPHPPSVPATVTMPQRRLFRAPKPGDEPSFVLDDDEDDGPPEIDCFYLRRLQEQGEAKRAERRSFRGGQSGGSPSSRGARRSSRLNAVPAEGRADSDVAAPNEEHASGAGSSTGTSGEEELYEVAAILDEDEYGGKGFLIQWAGYGAEHDSWEPEYNLAPHLVSEFRKERALARKHVTDDYHLGRKRMLWCSSCRAHFSADSFSAQQRKREPCSRSCLVHHYKTEGPRAPRSDVTGQRLDAAALSPNSTPIRVSAGLKRPRDERSPGSIYALPRPPIKAARPIAKALSTRQAALDLSRAGALFAAHGGE